MSRTPRSGIASRWYFFLIWPLLSAMGFYFLDSALTALKPYEVLSVFLGASSYQETEIDKTLNASKPSYVVELDTHLVSEDSSSFASLYQGYGPGSADVLLLNEKLMAGAAPKLAPLSADVAAAYFPECSSFWSVEDVHYGLLAHAKGSQTGGAITFKEDANYYLCFSAGSYHIGSLSKSQYDGAFVLGKAVLCL
jgi:hypothetical protein